MSEEITYLDLLIQYREKIQELLKKNQEIFPPDCQISIKFNTGTLSMYVLYCKGFYNILNNHKEQGIDHYISINYLVKLLGGTKELNNELCDELYKLICEIYKIIISAEENNGTST